MSHISSDRKRSHGVGVVSVLLVILCFGGISKANTNATGEYVDKCAIVGDCRASLGSYLVVTDLIFIIELLLLIFEPVALYRFIRVLIIMDRDVCPTRKSHNNNNNTSDC